MVTGASGKIFHINENCCLVMKMKKVAKLLLHNRGEKTQLKPTLIDT